MTVKFRLKTVKTAIMVVAALAIQGTTTMVTLFAWKDQN